MVLNGPEWSRTTKGPMVLASPPPKRDARRTTPQLTKDEPRMNAETKSTYSPTCWLCSGAADVPQSAFTEPAEWAHGGYYREPGYQRLSVCHADMASYRAAIDHHGEFTRRDFELLELDKVAELVQWDRAAIPNDLLRSLRLTTAMSDVGGIITLGSFAGANRFDPNKVPWKHLHAKAIRDYLNQRRSECLDYSKHRCAMCGIKATKQWHRPPRVFDRILPNESICGPCKNRAEGLTVQGVADYVATSLAGRNGTIEGASEAAGWQWFSQTTANGPGLEPFDYVNVPELAEALERESPTRSTRSGSRVLELRAERLPLPIEMILLTASQPAATF